MDNNNQPQHHPQLEEAIQTVEQSEARQSAQEVAIDLEVEERLGIVHGTTRRITSDAELMDNSIVIRVPNPLNPGGTFEVGGRLAIDVQAIFIIDDVAENLRDPWREPMIQGVAEYNRAIARVARGISNDLQRRFVQDIRVQQVIANTPPPTLTGDGIERLRQRANPTEQMATRLNSLRERVSQPIPTPEQLDPQHNIPESIDIHPEEQATIPVDIVDQAIQEVSEVPPVDAGGRVTQEVEEDGEMVSI